MHNFISCSFYFLIVRKIMLKTGSIIRNDKHTCWIMYSIAWQSIAEVAQKRLWNKKNIFSSASGNKNLSFVQRFLVDNFFFLLFFFYRWTVSVTNISGSFRFVWVTEEGMDVWMEIKALLKEEFIRAWCFDYVVQLWYKINIYFKYYI